MAVADHRHDGAAPGRGLGHTRRIQPPHVRPVDSIDVQRAVLQLRRRLGLEAPAAPCHPGEGRDALKQRAAAPRAIARQEGQGT